MARINHDTIKSQQYAVTHNWNLSFPIPSFIPSEVIQAIFPDPLQILNTYCETTEIPSSTTDIAEFRISRGRIHKQAIQDTPLGSITLTFLESNGYTISRFFDIWKNLGCDPLSNKQVIKAAYMLNRGFMMHALDGGDIPVATYELFGVYPYDVKLTGFTGDAELQRVNVIMSYTFYKRYF